MTESKIIVGDCIEVMSRGTAESVDAIVTDAPYGLGFMGKKWDALPPGEEWARECLRVLKPGGHLLCFGGTRTYHRLVCALEDVGFEIRDCIFWLYGTGFPKSLDVSKAIDKAAGAERAVIGRRVHPTLKNPAKVKSRAFHVETLDSDAEAESWEITAPATKEAREWDGWGTALKPACEPVVVARKPLAEKTVAANVLTHGTGAIHIDACRVRYEQGGNVASNPSLRTHINGGNGGHIFPQEKERRVVVPNTEGRWPANVVLDEDAAAVLDEQTGTLTSGKGQLKRNADSPGERSVDGAFTGTEPADVLYGDSGGASRFFYVAKATRKERDEGLDDFEARPVVDNGTSLKHTETGVQPGSVEDRFSTSPRKNPHPTVKPIALMCWLVRLVTPPGGRVLDPFLGSGTTGIACALEGFDFIGIEIDPEYAQIAEARIAHWTAK